MIDLLIILIIIIITVIFINIYSRFYTIREPLTNKNTIILMGDSILNNSNYVQKGESVFDLLKDKTNNVLMVAKDNATINDLYKQLDKLSYTLNNEDTFIFISAGGNNILNKTSAINNSEITKLFNNYINFINALRAKLPNVKINLLNLYLPANTRFQPFNEPIRKWNHMLEQNSDTIGQMYNVIDLYSLLNEPNDFVYGYEPSATASAKIANIIYLTQ